MPQRIRNIFLGLHKSEKPKAGVLLGDFMFGIIFGVFFWFFFVVFFIFWIIFELFVRFFLILIVMKKRNKIPISQCLFFIEGPCTNLA